jgi:hypothetical protein
MESEHQQLRHWINHASAWPIELTSALNRTLAKQAKRRRLLGSRERRCPSATSDRASESGRRRPRSGRGLACARSLGHQTVVRRRDHHGARGWRCVMVELMSAQTNDWKRRSGPTQGALCAWPKSYGPWLSGRSTRRPIAGPTCCGPHAMRAAHEPIRSRLHDRYWTKGTR